MIIFEIRCLLILIMQDLWKFEKSRLKGYYVKAAKVIEVPAKDDPF